MKTSQEILFEKFQSQDKVGLIRSELVVLIAEAMQAYADQQVNWVLNEAIGELKKWAWNNNVLYMDVIEKIEAFKPTKK